jgi:hypothetical protein
MEISYRSWNEAGEVTSPHQRIIGGFVVLPTSGLASAILTNQKKAASTSIMIVVITANLAVLSDLIGGCRILRRASGGCREVQVGCPNICPGRVIKGDGLGSASVPEQSSWINIHRRLAIPLSQDSIIDKAIDPGPLSQV